MRKENLLLFSAVIAAAILVMPWIAGCQKQSALEKIIPQDSVKGAYQGKISTNIIEVQHNKAVKGGDLVIAHAVVGDDITDEQIKPTCLGILKALKTEFPDCEWFDVWVGDDELMLKSSLQLARVEYKEGVIFVSGGVPTAADIDKHNAEIKDLAKSLGTTPVYTRKPTESEKVLTAAASEVRLQLYRDSRNQSKMITDDDIARATAKKLGVTAKEVDAARHLVFAYYDIKSSQTR